MDILQSIKKDHQETKDLFDKIMGATSEKAKAKDFAELRKELVPHIKAEENIFFPLLMTGDVKEHILEAYEEHHASETVLKELEKMPVGNERWPAKLKVLKDLVDHHTEEEESNILKSAQSQMDKAELKDLAGRFEAEKEKLRAKL